MRPQVLVLVGAAALFVVGGYFLMRGEHRDDVQDDRTARSANDNEKLAETTVVVADATRKLSGAVDQLSDEATRSDKRLDTLETESADLKGRVEAVEEYIPTRKAAIGGAFIASDFAIASMAKVAISEALMTMGKAPNSNAEAGLAVATDLRGQSLRATHVRPGGIVEMVYDQQSGVDGGIIRLIPDIELAMRSGIVNWRCETNDYPEIKKFMPTCRYVDNL